MQKFLMRHLPALAITGVLCAQMTTMGVWAQTEDPFRATVVSITDGDTIIVSRDRTPEKIRLLDVDSPEKGQPYGRVAKKFLSDLFYLREVTVSPAGKDKYGRTLASITRDDGLQANEALLRAGYAWVYRGKTKNSDLKTLEQEARESKRGLWQDPVAVAPWQYRKAQRELNSRKAPANISDAGGLVRQLMQERAPRKKTKRSTN